MLRRSLLKIKCDPTGTIQLCHGNARPLQFDRKAATGWLRTRRKSRETAFLSYREFVESIHVPAGREATWRDFSGWFARMRQAFRDIDGHQAFEEIRGVIAAGASGVLTREAYRNLGVRPQSERDKVYDLFEKYRVSLNEAKLYDLNFIAHEWQGRAERVRQGIEAGQKKTSG